MNKPHPGEIVQMSVAAGDLKARRQHHWRVARFLTVHVDKAGAVGPVRIRLQLEETRPEGCEQVAVRAAEPLGKRRDGDADRRTREGSGQQRLRLDGWQQQLCDLTSELRPYRGQQPLLVHRRRVDRIPVVEPHHHRGDAREVDQGTDSIGVEELGRPYLAHVVLHGWPPAASGSVA